MSRGANGMAPCLESANGMAPCLESANGMTPCLESANRMTPCLESANGMTPCLESANGMTPCLESANGMTPCLESANRMTPCLESANRMTPCLESPNGMAPCLESSNDEEVDTKNVKNMRLNKHKGPAIFCAPLPPSSSPTDKISEFIALSPPCNLLQTIAKWTITILPVGSVPFTVYSNKNSFSNESLRMKQS